MSTHNNHQLEMEKVMPTTTKQSEHQTDSLPELIFKQVQSNANKPAVTVGDQSDSYLNLWNHAVRFSELLEKENIATGGTIGICIDQNINLLRVVIGSLLRGKG